jgi:hypothetical protein
MANPQKVAFVERQESEEPDSDIEVGQKVFGEISVFEFLCQILEPPSSINIAPESGDTVNAAQDIDMFVSLFLPSVGVRLSDHQISLLLLIWWCRFNLMALRTMPTILYVLLFTSRSNTN